MRWTCSRCGAEHEGIPLDWAYDAPAYWEGEKERLGYGVWSTLSKDSFKRVVDLWDDPARTDAPPYFGWLSNSLPGYPETLNLPLDVVVQELDKRPLFVLYDGDHPLIEEQQRGISMARVQEIAELNMHEV